MPPPIQPYFYLPDGEQEKGSDGEKESTEQSVPLTGTPLTSCLHSAYKTVQATERQLL